jgi:hypothetical protein
LEVVSKLEGISGPSFSKSMTQASLFNIAGDEKVLWLKGNHQAVLIDIPTMEEIDRAPLFGSVNTYSDNIPLLVAASDGNWCGYFFTKNEYYLSWIEKGKEKQIKLLSDVVPEAKSLYSMHFDDTGQNLILLIGSTRELSQSSMVLISIRYGSTFAMNDYIRISDVLPNFCPSLTIAEGLWVINKGTSIQSFKVIYGLFELGLAINAISSGTFF